MAIDMQILNRTQERDAIPTTVKRSMGRSPTVLQSLTGRSAKSKMKKQIAFYIQRSLISKVLRKTSKFITAGCSQNVAKTLQHSPAMYSFS